jgi:hypothetical protein
LIADGVIKEDEADDDGEDDKKGYRVKKNKPRKNKPE